MNHTYVIIMAGGVGTRFWPFSRNNNPKQFHDVLGTGKSLLQQTASRFEGVCPPENIYIVTSTEYYGLVKEQLPFLTDDQILLEPNRRNTAPCIAYASYKIASKDPKATVIVAPADHIILKEDVFREKIGVAVEAAQNNDILITLGIQPTRPDTGYGYIQYLAADGLVKKVKTFTEKPLLDIAIKFLESGDFVWNAGIFIWNVKAIRKAFTSYLPEVAEVFEAGEKDYYTEQEKDFIEKAYMLCKNISIDFGIMEKAENVYVVLSDLGWSDLGTWKSLYDVSEKDNQQNVVNGKQLLYDTSKCIIKTSGDKLVVVQGLEGYIVAEHGGVLMICKIDDEQRVRDFVADAKQFGSEFI
ncbi:mannose-1-phosphate guanylyltransferase [Runella sp. MFBS21]|uniref:mannose-1-phosphate guanylyltransferase n=1 Tax=Runella sp. MFBS21 TaxID=3034018 RepID=UPI0023F69475|nr:mannose-1-phosphate guanylyltransferase [Runella sp. MFBS21]MDF7821019.1 mannose-1-phosphate guanylyltransferase [Runella sp. MFBS21]